MRLTPSTAETSTGCWRNWTPRSSGAPLLQVLFGGEATVYRGHEGVREFQRVLDEAFTELQVERSKYRASVSESSLSVTSEGAAGKVALTTETAIVWLVDFKSGKAVRVREYLDPKDALEAAGLSE